MCRSQPLLLSASSYSSKTQSSTESWLMDLHSSLSFFCRCLFPALSIANASHFSSDFAEHYLHFGQGNTLRDVSIHKTWSLLSRAPCRCRFRLWVPHLSAYTKWRYRTIPLDTSRRRQRHDQRNGRLNGTHSQGWSLSQRQSLPFPWRAGVQVLDCATWQAWVISDPRTGKVPSQLPAILASSTIFLPQSKAENRLIITLDNTEHTRPCLSFDFFQKPTRIGVWWWVSVAVSVFFFSTF